MKPRVTVNRFLRTLVASTIITGLICLVWYFAGICDNPADWPFLLVYAIATGLCIFAIVATFVMFDKE